MNKNMPLISLTGLTWHEGNRGGIQFWFGVRLVDFSESPQGEGGCTVSGCLRSRTIS